MNERDDLLSGILDSRRERGQDPSKTNIDKHMNYLWLAAVAIIGILVLFAVVQILDVYAPRGGRWAVVEGEKFQFSGFHHFSDGTIEKVDVTCVAKGMPVEPTQAVEMTCTPLNIYGHTPT